jgi:putative transposase
MTIRQTYGAPRIHAELKDEGTRVGRKRVARLMKESGLAGVSRRKSVVTTRRNRSARPAPDLVDRQFSADKPNQLWVADITYVPTWMGFLYLAVVLDVWSRKIVGWAMASHLRTSLVTAALDMAITQRSPTNVIHHSDQGCQYTSSSASGVAKPASGHRWAQSATAMTKPCARASSPRSSAS